MAWTSFGEMAKTRVVTHQWITTYSICAANFTLFYDQAHWTCTRRVKTSCTTFWCWLFLCRSMTFLELQINKVSLKRLWSRLVWNSTMVEHKSPIEIIHWDILYALEEFLHLSEEIVARLGMRRTHSFNEYSLSTKLQRTVTSRLSAQQ